AARGGRERVPSAPPGRAKAAPFPPPVHSRIDPQTSAPSNGVRFTESDLSFILDQIKVAEANAAGTPIRDLIPNWELPLGLRTLSGVNNNLLAGGAPKGAAHNEFPRLATPPVFPPPGAHTAGFF